MIISAPSARLFILLILPYLHTDFSNNLIYIKNKKEKEMKRCNIGEMNEMFKESNYRSASPRSPKKWCASRAYLIFFKSLIRLYIGSL